MPLAHRPPPFAYVDIDIRDLHTGDAFGLHDLEMAKAGSADVGVYSFTLRALTAMEVRMYPLLRL
jgi:hypothetical protein